MLEGTEEAPKRRPLGSYLWTAEMRELGKSGELKNKEPGGEDEV